MLKRIPELRTATARRRLRAFLGDSRGALAVEFALVALPFFFMIFAILELAVLFMLSATLDNATQDVARRIRTGESQLGGGGSKAAFRDAICDGMYWLQTSCKAAEGLKIDVRTIESFGASPPDLMADGKVTDSETLYDEGAPSSIVLVRAYYPWKLLTPFLTGALQRGSTPGSTVLTASTAFRNEPYQGGGT